MKESIQRPTPERLEPGELSHSWAREIKRLTLQCGLHMACSNLYFRAAPAICGEQHHLFPTSLVNHNLERI
jgi:hypothetical protein